MSEEKIRKRPRKQAPTYRHRKNAVSVTVYHPQGETIPAKVRDEVAESVTQVALTNGLLINIALT